jgi:hypothetical protein
MTPLVAVDLGPFFPPGTPAIGWEADNPLAYFNAAGFLLAILILVKLRGRRGESGMVDGATNAAWVFAVGTGLHFLGDIIGVEERWDHQFIHLVVLVALFAFWLGLRQDD